MYEQHQEGKVSFLRPPLQKVPSTDMPVFFNPKSELNRDITIITIQAFIDQNNLTSVRVCTPLAGTGVRAVRIAKEVSRIQKVVAGDANPNAVDLIIKNRDLNGVSDLVEVYHSGASQLLSRYFTYQKKFTVIDIDPFGSPREFFTATINALKAPGLLCLTATDMPVLVGIRRRTCVKRYAAVSYKTEYAHELALRILIGSVVREAAAQNISLHPLLGFSVDHYVRVFCEVKEGDAAVWSSMSNLGFIYHCNECLNRSLVQGLAPSVSSCPECMSANGELIGPLWIGKLGKKSFIEKVIHQLQTATLGTKNRTSSLLQLIYEEVEGPPTYRDLHRLADRISIPIPPFKRVISELRAKGEFCTRTHFSDHSIRTSTKSELLTTLLTKLSQEAVTCE
ncbi:MAG: tRNA (guanine(10)-N(2))-dimethyltransferase [Candidatus Hermodarchaeota archaeon]|nr:tRNA (guanine(10)-N(2))-dimethyltransferase [Candidatus Hermodarchaeota archaeon]